MAFYSSINLYRPFPAVQVTMAQIRAFIDSVAASDILRFVSLHGSLDPGSRHVERIIYALYRRLGREPDDRRYALDWFGLPPRQFLDSLAPPKRRIRRAHISIGALASSITDAISRRDSPENEHDFTPDTLGLTIGTAELYSLATDLPFVVGSIEVTLSGYGYLWPWKPADLLAPLGSCRPLNDLRSICNDIWPVQARSPTHREIARRRHLGELWMYESLDTPVSWLWGTSETG